jgi:hypothetical protein
VLSFAAALIIVLSVVALLLLLVLEVYRARKLARRERKVHRTVAERVALAASTDDRPLMWAIANAQARSDESTISSRGQQASRGQRDRRRIVQYLQEQRPSNATTAVTVE